MMNYFLTEEQKMIVDLARKLAVEKVKPLRDHYEEAEEFPWPLYEEMAKADLCGIYIEQ